MSASRDFPIPATSMRPGRQKTWLLRLFARHGFTLLLLLVFGFEVGVVFFLIQDVFIEACDELESCNMKRKRRAEAAYMP